MKLKLRLKVERTRMNQFLVQFISSSLVPSFIHCSVLLSTFITPLLDPLVQSFTVNLV